MNRKLCKVLLLMSLIGVIVLCSITNCFASSYSSYDGNNNNLSSTYVDFLKEYISDLNPDEDYILFRDGQYSYCLAVCNDGHFDFNTSTNKLSGSAEIMRLYVTTTGTGLTNNNYRVQVIEDPNFVYTYNNHMIYTNCINGLPSLQNSSNQSMKIPYIAIGIGIIILGFVGFKALSVSKGGMRA